MTPTKETLETGPAAKTTASAQSQPRADLSRLRADAVSLDVPVKVHGSRVTEVVRGATPHTEPFEEETSTMIVFPHGGVVRMATAVNVGQMLVLTNQRTSQDAICRVVKVRAYSNTQAYVEVEFTHRQLGYWGVHFPADDEEILPSVAGAPAPQPSAAEPAEKKPVVSSISMKIEPLPEAPATPARNESVFAQIGSKEQVQPAASQLEAKVPAAPVAPQPAPVARVAAPVHHVAPPPPAHAASSRELVEDKPLLDERDSDASAASGVQSFGTFTGGTGKPTHKSKAAEADVPAAVHSAPISGNWMWIGACVFFLVAGLSGGALYFRQHSSGASSTSQSSAPAPVATSQQNSLPAQEQTVQPSATVQSAVDPAPPAAADRSVRSAQASQAPVQASQSAQSVAENQARASNNSPVREGRPAPLVSQSFAAANARPVLRQTTSNTMAAPSVSPTASAPGASLSDVLSGSNAAPPPPEPMNRVRVGGALVGPKLTHSTAPLYPTAAKQANVSGDVVIAAHIDKAGNVASMKVISGQPSLQSAALAALKQWKYQPATLDGEPIETDVTVRLKFQAQ